jgi:hypothetical protein
MPTCICQNESHGHINPCGCEAAVGTDNLCGECGKKAAEEFYLARPTYQIGDRAPSAPQNPPVLTGPLSYSL